MRIHGLQKMTLLDYPEHVACTVFLAGCDFRCPFCHNYQLVDPAASHAAASEAPAEGGTISDAEFLSFLEKRKGLLDGVAITGGEPCLYPDLPEFIAKIKEKGFLVKLDTNGNHPHMLRKLIKEKLVDYVAMDIKNSPSKYPETVGLLALDLDPIRESVEILLEGQVPYEFRTTVIREFHEEKDFAAIGEMIRGAEKYFMQGFINRETVPNQKLTPPDLEEMNKFQEIVRPFVKSVAIRGME